MSSATPIPPLSLSFSLTTTARSRTRLYSLAVASSARLLSSPTEQLPALPLPARFATTVLLPTSTPSPSLQLLVAGAPRGSAPLSLPLLLEAANHGTPLYVQILNTTVKVWADLYQPSLATHEATFRVASRGVVNAFCAAMAPDCEVVVSRRRRDASWQAVYRSLRSNDAGGSVLLRCRDDASDVAIKVEATAVKGKKRVAMGETSCSLGWLREREVGERMPLREEGKRKGYVVVASVDEEKAESGFVFEVYLYGRCGPDLADLGMVMVNDAETSLPGSRVQAEEMVKVARGRRRSESWVRAMWRVVRMHRDRGRMQETVLQAVRGVEKRRSDGGALPTATERRF